jgi:hypothetical protein
VARMALFTVRSFSLLFETIVCILTRIISARNLMKNLPLARSAEIPES